MSHRPVYIAAVGMISPLGQDTAAGWRGLLENRCGLGRLTRFSVPPQQGLPVGEAPGLEEEGDLPRTHRLALLAAGEAMAGAKAAPDAVILGTTTGGMERSERLLRDGCSEKFRYRYHGLHTVCRQVARSVGCGGPALTISTACSSGALAIALALAMLRRGQVETVLAGGVDSLCRLTYFGFNALQLVDRNGCRPLDRNRHGMVVAEGAGMLLLTTVPPPRPLAQLLGAGLSCDAYHPAAPHPEGAGALAAMRRALNDSGLGAADIDYLNLHGTGTPDNDSAEARAINRLFPVLPPHSSTKGATGHTLAAAGAIEAVIAVQTVVAGMMPGNTGLGEVDPSLRLSPLDVATAGRVRAVLSNSFGFGGNNGALVIAQPHGFPGGQDSQSLSLLAVHGYACLSGAGDTKATLAQAAEHQPLSGPVPLERLAFPLPPALMRRAKQLPRLMLHLAASLAAPAKPAAIFAGSAWGGLSETHDFLERLSASGELFPSPTDFVGSVHNSSAGQVATLFGADGPNFTHAGGDASFEEAVFSAEHLHDDATGTALLLGADEAHPIFSPLFDPSVASHDPLAEGGGALLVSRQEAGALCFLNPLFHGSDDDPEAVRRCGALLSRRVGEVAYGLILVGIPAGAARGGEEQLAHLLQQGSLNAPLCRYRQLTGEFASASALATALAVAVLAGDLPATALGGLETAGPLPAGSSILLLGLGECLTAIELAPGPGRSSVMAGSSP